MSSSFPLAQAVSFNSPQMAKRSLKGPRSLSLPFQNSPGITVSVNPFLTSGPCRAPPCFVYHVLRAPAAHRDLCVHLCSRAQENLSLTQFPGDWYSARHRGRCYRCAIDQEGKQAGREARATHLRLRAWAPSQMSRVCTHWRWDLGQLLSILHLIYKRGKMGGPT